MRFLLSVLIPLVVGATGGAASLVGWTIAWFLYSLFSQAVGLNDKGSFFGMSLMGLPVVGTICGLSVALVLHKTSLAKQKMRIREIAIGWIIGF